MNNSIAWDEGFWVGEVSHGTAFAIESDAPSEPPMIFVRDRERGGYRALFIQEKKRAIGFHSARIIG